MAAAAGQRQRRRRRSTDSPLAHEYPMGRKGIHLFLGMPALPRDTSRSPWSLAVSGGRRPRETPPNEQNTLRKSATYTKQPCLQPLRLCFPNTTDSVCLPACLPAWLREGEKGDWRRRRKQRRRRRRRAKKRRTETTTALATDGRTDGRSPTWRRGRGESWGRLRDWLAPPHSVARSLARSAPPSVQ